MQRGGAARWNCQRHVVLRCSPDAEDDNLVIEV
jgi:hypothetical protein